MSKEAIDLILASSLLWVPALAVGIAGLIAWTKEAREERRSRREQAVLKRAEAGLPAHVRCSCDVCAAWRRAMG